METFRCHASYSYHRTAVLNADNIIAILNNKQDNVLVQLNNQLKEDILQNRNMLKPIIQTIRLCGRQQFGLRGHQDSGRISMKEPIQNDGNFRCLLRHRAQHGDSTLKKYLENCSSNAMYTSPLIQNEIINIFGELIQSDIIKKISKSNYFSVLADETTDIAQIEQFSICIRYFEEELVVLREDFLTFVPVHDVTGLGLATVLLNALKELGLDLDKLRGQGYDGAATMSGNFRGVQAIVKKSYPKALYTHCVSHSLNLCLSDAAKTQAIRNSFSIISDCCGFFHSSAKRTTILKNKIIEILPNTQSFKLKSLCETRWVLRHEAVMLFKEFLEPIVAALEQIDCDSSNRTTSLLNTICNFKFLVSVCVSSKLLSYTYHLSEYLQTKNIDLVNALDRVNQVTIQLQILRDNATDEFNKIYEEVNRLGGLINVEESMPRICITQRNRQNVPFQSTKEFYRRTVFIPHLDDILLSLNERFLSHHEIINSLQYVLPNMIVDKPYSNLKTAITFYQNDLKGYDDIIEAEYQLWQSKWNLVESRPSTAIEALHQCDQLMYPNMYELLKILSILPVSTATAERSFSTLRRLKNYLRNTTSESRLVGLALLSIHRDVDITDDMVLDKFSNSGKSRRLKLTI